MYSVPASIKAGGEKEKVENSPCLAIKYVITLLWGGARVSSGVQGCSELTAAYSGNHKMAAFQHMALLFRTLVERQTPTLRPVTLAKVSEYSVEILKGRESQNVKGLATVVPHYRQNLLIRYIFNRVGKGVSLVSGPFQ